MISKDTTLFDIANYIIESVLSTTPHKRPLPKTAHSTAAHAHLLRCQPRCGTVAALYLETPMSLQAFNFRRWIDAHREFLKPPVGNHLVFRDSEFIVMVVGGPNSRSDYHIDPSEEFFYQLEGDMVLKTMQDGQPVDVAIREGDVFLLPPNMPHSPRRPAHTVGLVIERARRADELEGFVWYCDNCHHRLYEEYLHVSNIETQLAPVFARFYGNLAQRTCQQCGTVLTPPSQPSSGRHDAHR
jgi:3-hydroxyanthranilate 3,4-dioxygenase